MALHLAWVFPEGRCQQGVNTIVWGKHQLWPLQHFVHCKAHSCVWSKCLAPNTQCSCISSSPGYSLNHLRCRCWAQCLTSSAKYHTPLCNPCVRITRKIQSCIKSAVTPEACPRLPSLSTTDIRTRRCFVLGNCIVHYGMLNRISVVHTLMSVTTIQL